MRINSLLGNFEELEASINPKEEIKQFIEDNYKTKGHLQISNEPNENGKYVVNCYANVHVINFNIISLTNNIFEWGIVGGHFNCGYCNSLTSLKGAPKVVDGSFICSECQSLISLEGAPDEVVGRSSCFSCSYCNSLKTLEGAPKTISGDFNCSNCNSLTSLKGAPEEVGGHFNCVGCKSLASLKGAPEKVGWSFDCSYCESLMSLKDAPKKVGQKVGQIFFRRAINDKFTKHDIEKICDANYIII